MVSSSFQLRNLILSEREKHDMIVVKEDKEKHIHFIYGLETALNLIEMGDSVYE